MVIPILLAAAAVAAPPCAVGVWDLKAEDRAIFRLAIANGSGGPTAVWDRPETFRSDGERFWGLGGQPVHRDATRVAFVDGAVEARFADPRPGAAPDILRLRCARPDHLTVTYENAPFEPFDFVRVPADGPPIGPWDADRTYTRVIDRPTNAEMTAIFAADQADRQGPQIDWSVIGPRDTQRQLRTQALLDAGALQSGDDFANAAFVFQHGDTADDYLKAHLLAMVAVARGNSGAAWIASATLDRYLQAIGRPQVLGTQFTVPNGGPATQDPYDRTLVSDTMRKALRVPSQTEQEQRRQRYTEDAREAVQP